MPQLELRDYQSHWPGQFAQAADGLYEAFAGLDVRIEHVGSTSVPGLPAKPVLDLLLGATDLGLLMSRREALASIGYAYRPEYETQLPDRRYFVRPASTLPRIHLHAVVTNGKLWTDHLLFRDALRSNATIAREYAALKRDLAARFAHDKPAYTRAKEPFISATLARIRDLVPERGPGAS